MKPIGTLVLRGVITLLLVAGLIGAARAAVEDEVRATFERFVQVQNEHDVKALEALLIDSPRFLWITRGTVIWGRDAALARFSKLYEGTWRLDPEPGLQIVLLGDGTAQLHATVVFTTGAAGQPAQTSRTFLNQVWVKVGNQWRVAGIFPIPAPAP